MYILITVTNGEKNSGLEVHLDLYNVSRKRSLNITHSHSNAWFTFNEYFVNLVTMEKSKQCTPQLTVLVKNIND